MAIFDVIYDTYKSNSYKSSCEFIVLTINLNNNTAFFDGNTYYLSDFFVCESIKSYEEDTMTAIGFRLNDEIIILDKLM